MRKIVLLLGSLALAACNSNSGGGNSGSGAQGFQNNTGQTAGIWIIEAIHSECGASTASLSIASYNGYTSVPIRNVQVANGGSVDFNVQPGTYMISSSAGNCSLQGTVQYPAEMNTYDLTLCTTSCQQTQYGYYHMNAKVQANNFRAANETTCAWNVYGCSSQSSTGTGAITIQHAEMNFSTKKNTDLSMNLTFTKGNNFTMATPALGKNGWSLTAQADGTVKVANVAYPALVYDAQVDDSLLQFTDGFCDSRDKIPAKMADYLNNAGFSSTAVGAFNTQWANRMPPNATLCIYPQTEAQIEAVVADKSSVATNNHRVWFIVIPQQDAALSKIHKPSMKYIAMSAKPKNDAFKTLKAKMTDKTRSIANTSDVTVEETAVGFLIE